MGSNRSDLALAAGLIVLGMDDIPGGVAVWNPATVLAGAAVGMAVAWRRRWPVAVALIAFAVQFGVDVGSGIADQPAELPLGQVLALAVLVYSVARWVPWRTALPVLAVATVLEVVGEGLAVASSWSAIGDSALSLGLAGAVGLAVRYRRAVIDERFSKVRYEERERIARELHDVMAHHVSAIAIQAEGAKALSRTDPEAACAVLDIIHDTASRALLDTREILLVLRDPAEGELPAPRTGLDQLEALATTGSAQPVVVVTVVGAPELPTGVGAALSRIAGEAVTNARRHGRGVTEVRVAVARHRRSVTLTVTDDGQPVRGDVHPGLGVRGMEERASILGGRLRTGPRPDGRGWEVEATIPLPEAEKVPR